MKRLALFIFVTFSFLMPFSLATNSLAVNFPTKPIRLIVPFPAGGTTDIFARILAQKLSENLGQQVLVDNRAGASGIIGSEIVVKSPADGHTLLMTATHHVVNPSLYKKLPYDTLKDFAAVSLIATSPNVLVAHPSFPAGSIKELIALAKAKPGQINFASTGIGGANHLSGEMLKAMAGIDLVHIPYKGAAPAMNDLLGGHVSLMFDTIGVELPYVKAGKLKALGVTTAKRTAIAPEIPTIAESGVPGYEALSWFGMYGPAGMPKEIITRLNSEVVKILNLPEVHKKFIAYGAETASLNPDQFAAFVKSEMAKWGRVVKGIGLQLD
jgi:tripartite-type tricarboxylate transporter receptor subunit TctC